MSLIRWNRLSVRLAVHRTSESNEYPILKKVDILLALGLAEHMVPERKYLRINARQAQFNSETVTTEFRNKIVNHLSRMAGATILEYGTNELIWQKIMEIMYALIPFPRDRFFERNRKFSVYAGCSKDDIDLHNDLPPIRYHATSPWTRATATILFGTNFTIRCPCTILSFFIFKRKVYIIFTFFTWYSWRLGWRYRRRLRRTSFFTSSRTEEFYCLTGIAGTRLISSAPISIIRRPCMHNLLLRLH